MTQSKFLKTALVLSIPIALQNLLASFLTLVDNVMVGRLGDTAIAAVSQANQLFFLLNLALFGTCSGMQIFAAQFWGKRDLSQVRKVLGLGLVTVLGISALFTVIGVAFPQLILNLLSKDPEVIRLGIGYERIVSLSFLFTGVSMIYSAMLRSVEQVRLPLFATLFSLFVNVVLNYLLIFGKYGFPLLGVNGAAIATLIARIVECGILLFMVYKKDYPIAAKIGELFSFPKDFARNCLKIVAPVIANESLWSLGLCTFAVLYGYLGTPVVAATNIVSTVQKVMSAFFFGTSYAAAIMIGKEIGAGNRERAFRYGRYHMILGLALGTIGGLLMILFRNTLVGLFDISSEAKELSRQMMVIYGVAMVFNAVNVVGICGLLRAGGDTKISLYIDTGTVWLMALPLGIITIALGATPTWVYLAIQSDCIVKFLLLFFRLRGKRWMHNVVENL